MTRPGNAVDVCMTGHGMSADARRCLRDRSRHASRGGRFPSTPQHHYCLCFLPSCPGAGAGPRDVDILNQARRRNITSNEHLKGITDAEWARLLSHLFPPTGIKHLFVSSSCGGGGFPPSPRSSIRHSGTGVRCPLHWGEHPILLVPAGTLTGSRCTTKPSGPRRRAAAAAAGRPLTAPTGRPPTAPTSSGQWGSSARSSPSSSRWPRSSSCSAPRRRVMSRSGSRGRRASHAGNRSGNHVSNRIGNRAGNHVSNRIGNRIKH